jgi:hypothetical protein
MSNLSGVAPFAAASLDEHDALPAGTRFGELEILRVVGVGGFGIVYLARDHSLDRDVALKEYMPGQLAARGPSVEVSVRSGAHMETFVLGLRSFVNEARLLARFDHRSLVKVYRFWEANNTAYMVMPFLQGHTLRDARRAMTNAPDEAWMRQTLNPLMEALELLHREAVYHRDIAPDNILLPHDGSQAVLLDFGAARRAIGDRTQTFTAILKPSYAPIEQYAESVSLRQGPWTDIYALGAVIHYVIKGVPPAPATARALDDHCDVLAKTNVPGISPTFLAAVDWALAVRPQDRPQSVAEFRDALDGKITPPSVSRHTAAAPVAANPGVKIAGDSVNEKTRFAAAATAATDEPTRLPRPGHGQRIAPDPHPRGRVTAPVEGATAWSGLGAWAVAIPAVLLVVAAAAWWWSARLPAQTGLPAVNPPATTGPAPMASPGAAPVPSTVLTAVPTQVAAEPLVATPTPVASKPIEPVSPPKSNPIPPMAAALPKTTAPLPALPAQTAAANPNKNDTAVPRLVLEPKPARPAATGNEPVRPSETPSASGQLPTGAPLWPPVPAEPTKPRAQAANDGASSPTEACGGRVFLALLQCIERQCKRPRFSSHSQCADVRARREQSTQEVYGGSR